MHGCRVMITGATSGIGRATALALAAMGADLIIVARSPRRAGETADLLRAAGSRSVTVLLADLSLLAEVRRLGQAFAARNEPLDVLVNNAGAIFMSRSATAEGLESTFALNHLSQFLLTHLLLPCLQAAAAARGEARIVNVASIAHEQVQRQPVDWLGRGRYDGRAAYARSKLANVLFTYELARRLEGTGISVNAVHPGIVRTNIGQNNNLLIRVLSRLFHLFSTPPEEGVKTVVYLASAPELRGTGGAYFYEERPVPTSPLSHDAGLRRELWQLSEELTGLQKA